MLIILVSWVALMTFTGCDRRAIEVPTNPQLVDPSDASRVLAFEYYTTIDAQDYYNIVLYETTNPRDIGTDDIVEIEVGDSLIAMYYFDFPGFGRGWFAEDSHLITANQSIKLNISNQTVLSSYVKPVKRASAAFPENYDYQESQVLNWSVLSGNQYQFVKAEAWFHNLDGAYAPYDSYLKQISTETRTHTFPANCLTLTGDLSETTFVLAVQEVNYKIVSSHALMVYQTDSYGYQGERRASNKQNFLKSAQELRSILTQARAE